MKLWPGWYYHNKASRDLYNSRDTKATPVFSVITKPHNEIAYLWLGSEEAANDVEFLEAVSCKLQS